MIERLGTSIRAIAEATAKSGNHRPDQALVDECADAVRLQLDCMQQDMSLGQRVALENLLDSLEDETVPGMRLAIAVRDAATSLGLSPTLPPATA